MRPQAPQLAALVWVFTQLLPQSIVPLGQAQRPAEHAVPPAQVLPQAPQLVLLVWRLMHAEPHMVLPAAQTQAPATQA